MLQHLSIRNIVLIDKLDLDFQSGLTVFTGETGAGKSILLDSLSLALGARADLGLIRHGETEASVSASFSLPLTHPIGAILSAHGYPFDGECILRRTLSSDGRSRAFINDEPVSISLLKSIGDSLIEIHGQFASHKLLNPATHIDTLDAYGNLSDIKSECRHAFTQWQFKKEQRNHAEQDLMKAQREEEFLKTSVADLEQLGPEENEEEILTERRIVLMNSEKIITALGQTYALLSNEENGILTPLGEALSTLEKANHFANGSLSDLTDSLSSALAILDDTTQNLEKKMDDWGDESELSSIDDRLFALRDMARKHHCSISELPALYIKLKEQLSQLEIGESTIIQLQKAEEEARLNYITVATHLTQRRQHVASLLDTAVAAELPALKLGKAVFKTDISPLDETNWGEKGMDRVAFLVSTNKGTPMAPIHKIASGGELARFMLALKVNLATTDDIETLIFDEVDTGIGGATAAAVGARLKRLAQHNQILVITHSPQVASYGQVHLTVQKSENQNQVRTTVSQLDDKMRLAEIARMLSGEHITKTANTMAEELLSSCQN